MISWSWPACSPSYWPLDPSFEHGICHGHRQPGLVGRDGRSCSSFRSHSPGAVPPCDIPTMASTTTPTTTDQQRHAFSTLLWVKVGYIWLYNVIQCYTTLYICWLYNRWLLFFINHWFFAPPTHIHIHNVVAGSVPPWYWSLWAL